MSLPEPEPSAPLAAADALQIVNRLKQHLGTVFLGKPEVVHLALISLLADGHLLIEDVPGVGKTLLAKALSRSLTCQFQRIQFTPDLLPSDLIGTSVYHQSSGQFAFTPGPIFTQILLADEINRATPRTQSALLEAMSERQVTIDGQTRRLAAPFLVLATQNPFEFEGTYPLPESQLDRFLLRIRIGYPSRQAEKAILTQHRNGEPVEQLAAIVTPAEVLALQACVRGLRFDDKLQDYLLEIVEATRTSPQVNLGASTRAALGLYRAAQAHAFLQGRSFVVPDDIKSLADPVLAHRLILKSLRHQGQDDPASALLNTILAQTHVPA